MDGQGVLSYSYVPAVCTRLRMDTHLPSETTLCAWRGGGKPSGTAALNDKCTCSGASTACALNTELGLGKSMTLLLHDGGLKSTTFH